MLPVEAEEALAELVALGMVNSDSFGGLRALLGAERPARPGIGPRRPAQTPDGFVRDGGCRALGAGAPACGAGDRAADEESIEHVVRTLLRRWGVIFWQPARPRSGLAAAVARHRDVLPAAGGARGDSRRTLRRRLLGRAVRRARGHRAAARGAPPAAHRPATSRSRAPIRSIYSVLSRRGRACPRSPATGFSTGTACRSRPMRPEKSNSSRSSSRKEEWEARNAVLRRHVPAALIALDDPG